MYIYIKMKYHDLKDSIDMPNFNVIFMKHNTDILYDDDDVKIVSIFQSGENIHIYIELMSYNLWE
jgi:hypothetical protein